MNNPLLQRNSHGQLLVYLRKCNLTSCLDLWWADNLKENELSCFFVMSNVSPPLTVATEDYAMWFPTHEHYSGTGKSMSVYQKYG